MRKWLFTCYQKEMLSQYANGLQELITTLQRKENMGAILFTNAELVVCDKFLLGMRSQLLCSTLWKRLKLEPNLTMLQVLKEANVMEKEEQIKAIPAEMQARATWRCA